MLTPAMRATCASPRMPCRKRGVRLAANRERGHYTERYGTSMPPAGDLNVARRPRKQRFDLSRDLVDVQPCRRPSAECRVAGNKAGSARSAGDRRRTASRPPRAGRRRGGRIRWLPQTSHTPSTCGRCVALVIAGAAFGAAEAAGEPVDQRRLVDLDQDHSVELEPAPRQHAIERLGLRHGARKAVEDEAALAPPGWSMRSAIMSITMSSETSSPAP